MSRNDLDPPAVRTWRTAPSIFAHDLDASLGPSWSPHASRRKSSRKTSAKSGLRPVLITATPSDMPGGCDRLPPSARRGDRLRHAGPADIAATRGALEAPSAMLSWPLSESWAAAGRVAPVTACRPGGRAARQEVGTRKLHYVLRHRDRAHGNGGRCHRRRDRRVTRAAGVERVGQFQGLVVGSACLQRL